MSEVESKNEAELISSEDAPLPELHSAAAEDSLVAATGPADSLDDGGIIELPAQSPQEDEIDVAGCPDDGDQAAPPDASGPAPEVTTEQVVEAILFGDDAPLTPAKIVTIVGTGSARDIRQHIENLNKRYHEMGASFRVEKIAGGYQMLTLPAFNTWLKRFKQTRQDSKLSQAALETLAVVAYKQPVVRAEIEAIRGVAAGEMLNRLRELGLVKIVGRAEDVGRPLLYGTTKRFLDVVGLAGLEDLPTVEELKSPE